MLKSLILFLPLVLPAVAQKQVHYDLQFPNAVHHEAEVRATFTGVSQPVLEVVMSSSSPGRYALHEFAKNVYHVRASDGNGHELRITRMTPSQWNISGHHGKVVVEYTLYGDRGDGTYDQIDQTHAHLNMPATLVWAHGFEKAPASVKFDVPPNSRWTAATELIPDDGGSWTAPNLDMLMDGPVELSNHSMPEWKIEGQTFRLSLHQRGTEKEADDYARMCKAVVLEEEGVFGAFPRYDGGTYTFLVDYLPYVSGDGMEHRDSTVITSPHNLSDSAGQLIETVAHEFFHSWNVRRIRPASLQPFDFERADMSGELWFAEGFTNYYGPLTLKRSGISSLAEFASTVGGAVSAVLTAPGRKVHNVIGMSELAPFVDAATSIDPTNFSNTFISYYIYGEALAVGIDLSIRTRFPGKTLDDWMRTLWREHFDVQRPYTLDDLQNTLAETTGSKAFADEVFHRYIYGKEAMNYQELISHAGLLLRTKHPGKVWLGANGKEAFKFSGEAVEIANGTLADSPLYNAGLDRGDRILKWNGEKFSTQNDLDSWLDKQKPGEHVQLQVETRAGERNVDVVLQQSPELELVPYEDAGMPATPEITRFRNAWLSSKALHPLPELQDKTAITH
jgi:predicted metalloprotease with PDZ domain